MSDDTNSTQSIFARHRKAVLGTVSVIIVMFTLLVAIAQGWLPNLFAVFGNWLVLSVISLGLFTLGMVYLYYKYNSGSRRDWPFMGASPVEQLSKAEAKELSEWALFSKEPPIKPGRYERDGVKKVRQSESGSSARIYEAVFHARNSAETYAVLMNLEEHIEFEIEWLEDRTPDNLAKATEAVQGINDWEVLQQRDAETLEEFEARVTETRENMGQSIRGQEVTEYYEDGEKTRVEKRDVIPVKVQEDSD